MGRILGTFDIISNLESRQACNNHSANPKVQKYEIEDLPIVGFVKAWEWEYALVLDHVRE